MLLQSIHIQTQISFFTLHFLLSFYPYISTTPPLPVAALPPAKGSVESVLESFLSIHKGSKENNTTMWGSPRTKEKKSKWKMRRNLSVLDERMAELPIHKGRAKRAGQRMFNLRTGIRGEGEGEGIGEREGKREQEGRETKQSPLALLLCLGRVSFREH